MHCCLLLRIGTNSRLAALRTTTFARNTQRIVQSRVSTDRRLILDLDAPAAKKTNSNGSSNSQKKRIEWSAGSIGMLIIPAFAFSLGCWQVMRLQWKTGLLEHLKARLSQPAQQLPEDLSQESLEPLEYTRVSITGEFLHDREFIISPRGRFDPGKTTSASAGSLLSENEMSSHGGHLITPFRLYPSGNVILINRGWLPSFYFDRDTREKTNPKGRISLEAIVRKTEKRPQFVGKNVPEQGVWYYRDLEQMAEAYGTLPVWLDAAYETTVAGGPIGGQTNVNVRNEHMNYLTTWYTLTIVTLLMWIHKFRK